MTKTREQILAERRRLRAEYGELFDSVAALLFRHDPIGINFDENTDEYEAETGTILPRLSISQSADEVLEVVHEEFVRWFDPVTAGPRERYRQIASEIWQLWRRHPRDWKLIPPHRQLPSDHRDFAFSVLPKQR